MKKNLIDFVAGFALLFALIGFASVSALAQNLTCNGSNNSRTIDNYGFVTAGGSAAVQNMPVRAYAYSESLGLEIITTYTDQFGTYHLNLYCGRPYYITVDTKHPNGDFGNTPDASPVNDAVEFDVNSSPLHHAADFDIPSCDLPSNTTIYAGVYQRAANSSNLSPVSGVNVVALNPQDNSLQSYAVSYIPQVQGDVNAEIEGLFPCTTYRVIAYFDPATYQYVVPAESLANTGFIGDKTIGGVSVTGWNSIGNLFIGVLR